MKDLILENRFDELKARLQQSNGNLAVHRILLHALNNKPMQPDEYGFAPDRYQQEFAEGLELYKALEGSRINAEQLRVFTQALNMLAFKLGGLIKAMANDAMQKGMYLSQAGGYRVTPELRDQLQEFIELLKKRNELKAIANVAAAKAQVTTSIGELLKKEDIGRDMLQFADAYAAVGEKERAIQVYRGVVLDFESASVQASSGLFPEIAQVDTRPQTEIEVYEEAKMKFATLSGEKLPETRSVHVSENRPEVKAVVNAVHKTVQNTAAKKPSLTELFHRNQIAISSESTAFKTNHNYKVYDTATRDEIMQWVERPAGQLTTFLRYTTLGKSTSAMIDLKTPSGEVIMTAAKTGGRITGKMEVLNAAGRLLATFDPGAKTFKTFVALDSAGGELFVVSNNIGSYTYTFRSMTELAVVRKKTLEGFEKKNSSANTCYLEIDRSVTPDSPLRPVLWAATLYIDLLS